MAKFEMKKTACGPAGNYVAGRVYEDKGTVGADFVKAGAAVWWTPKKERAVNETRETRGHA